MPRGSRAAALRSNGHSAVGPHACATWQRGNEVTAPDGMYQTRCMPLRQFRCAVVMRVTAVHSTAQHR